MSASEGQDSVLGELSGNVHPHSSSSSDSDDYKPSISFQKIALFGRQKPIHSILGGGKTADIILWRNKKISLGVFVGVTAAWLIFEWLGYHLLTLVCHVLIASLAILFCWSSMSCAINRSMPRFPEVLLSEDLAVSLSLSVCHEINQALTTFQKLASGADIKRFVMVIACLWVLSVAGSWFTFLTFFYIVFVILCTVPVMYERHEDAVDGFAVRARVEISKQYEVLNVNFLQKIPRSPFKGRKLT